MFENDWKCNHFTHFFTYGFPRPVFLHIVLLSPDHPGSLTLSPHVHNAEAHSLTSIAKECSGSPTTVQLLINQTAKQFKPNGND